MSKNITRPLRKDEKEYVLSKLNKQAYKVGLNRTLLFVIFFNSVYSYRCGSLVCCEKSRCDLVWSVIICAIKYHDYYSNAKHKEQGEKSN